MWIKVIPSSTATAYTSPSLPMTRLRSLSVAYLAPSKRAKSGRSITQTFIPSSTHQKMRAFTSLSIGHHELCCSRKKSPSAWIFHCSIGQRPDYTPEWVTPANEPDKASSRTRSAGHIIGGQMRSALRDGVGYGESTLICLQRLWHNELRASFGASTKGEQV